MCIYIAIRKPKSHKICYWLEKQTPKKRESNILILANYLTLYCLQIKKLKKVIWQLHESLQSTLLHDTEDAYSKFFPQEWTSYTSPSFWTSLRKKNLILKCFVLPWNTGSFAIGITAWLSTNIYVLSIGYVCKSIISFLFSLCQKEFAKD